MGNVPCQGRAAELGGGKFDGNALWLPGALRKLGDMHLQSTMADVESCSVTVPRFVVEPLGENSLISLFFMYPATEK